MQLRMPQLNLQTTAMNSVALFCPLSVSAGCTRWSESLAISLILRFSIMMSYLLYIDSMSKESLQKWFCSVSTLFNNHDHSALVLPQKLPIFYINVLSLHFLQLNIKCICEREKVQLFFFPHQHMLEKWISLYSYMLHPTSESWHWERWFFSCNCVFYRLHNFLASRNSLRCLLLSLCRHYCVSLNVIQFWFSPTKLHQVFKSLWILTTRQALMQKKYWHFYFCIIKSTVKSWKVRLVDIFHRCSSATLSEVSSECWASIHLCFAACSFNHHLRRFFCGEMKNSTKRMVWCSCFLRHWNL